MRLTRLEEWRRKRFLSQAELADKAGVSKNTVHRLERGITEPRGSTARKLAAALAVEPAELVGE